MTVKAKFRVHLIQKAEDDSHRVIHLSAVTADKAGNEDWSKYTPSGDIRMHVTNPAAFEQFAQGVDYFVEFSKAE
ncbi:MULTISPECIES: hypothetical protein [Rahnella]|uniref:Uncharacterized protein n=1 Tax=Rahnella laticis TaxID=2787622 RepID=A0ABS0E0L1_9GAMM|nr:MULTISPECIES: hypothetical protein [Rahnella]MBF7978628.1 hypothetical protein [Rahnella laticis]MBF7998718.1 hypothetical protein [Rahnella sp. LAC-M12]